MIRNKILYVGLIGTVLSSICVLGSKQNEGEKFDIVYLDKCNDKTIKNLSSLKTISKKLDETKDAYVLNQESFDDLDGKIAQNYLDNGGIIVVNDNEVTSEELKKKIDTNVIDFDYSDEENQYGFYVYNDGEKNVTVNVSLGFLTKESKRNTRMLNMKSVTDIIDEKTIVESIVSKATSKISLNHNFSLQDGSSTGGGISSSTSGKTIAMAYLENILYLESDNTKACSYTIYTNVVDVAKVKDSSDVIRGVYDISSSFILDAESKYAITDYSVRMRNLNTILDASYLNSNTSTTVSLGGSIGFQGDEISGSLEGGMSYTYTPDSQEISNDLSAGSDKYWKSNVINETYGTSRKLVPSIRILNSSDSYSTNEYSRVESFNIKDDGWWIFQNNYYMMDKYRKELCITWNSSGYVSQTTYTG